MSVLYVRDKDGRLIPVGSSAAPPDLSDYVRSVNGVEPDENGNVKITIPDSGGNVDCLPEYSEADNGKVLGIVNGTPAWIEATINGGGETPDVPDVPDTPVEPTSHGIVWDLVNVTSDNNLVSVTDGASLIAVLTPADGYTLGDVTVTMGGEVLTGVWNAETATVTIASVTGDVVISCVGMEKSFVSTSPVIEFADYSASGNTGIAPSPSKPGWGITKLYESSAVSITYCYTNASATISPTGGKTKTLAYTINDDGSESIVDYFSPAFNGLAQNSGFDPHTHIRACLVMEEIEDAYFYENDTGKVIFAGKNTPYYGMANIDGTMLDGSYKTSVLSLDDDIAQNYTVATTSILGEDTESDTNHHYGISSEYAEVIDEVRTAWMTEYGGDYRKIPIIVTTDQHGGTSKGLFNMLGKVLSMHDVSKIMNLGDTVSGWRDADIDHPLRSCEGLKNWCESVKAIPFSKQLNVFGNHDTWYGNYEDEGNLIGTRYPSSQAHLYQYFRNIYARRTNNNGWFVVYDDAFNVKYVVPSQYEYPNNSMASTIGTKQMTWLISELEKQDGYDVVIVSHAPILIQPENAVYPTGDTNTTTYTELSILQGLVSARFTKTAGTITDSDGVEHSFDFTDCDGDLLCSLHGHTHADIYQYVDDTMVNYTFDRFQDDTIFFALIDRVNRVLNIWKVEGDNLSYQNYQVPLDKPTV